MPIITSAQRSTSTPSLPISVTSFALQSRPVSIHLRKQSYHSIMSLQHNSPASPDLLCRPPSNLYGTGLARPPRYLSRSPSGKHILQPTRTVGSQSRQPEDSSKKKNKIFSMFRKLFVKKSHAVRNPPTVDSSAKTSHPQSSLKSTNPSKRKTVHHRPVPQTVHQSQHASGSKNPDQKVYLALELPRRKRTMSHVSVEVQDNLPHTAVSVFATLCDGVALFRM